MHFRNRTCQAKGSGPFSASNMQKEKICQFKGNLEQMLIKILNTDCTRKLILVAIYILC